VQFDITESGATANARVISSSNTCLNAAAVKAVLGWKYPPNARRGVTESFVFTLTD
jgi:TonB family protein